MKHEILAVHSSVLVVAAVALACVGLAPTEAAATTSAAQTPATEPPATAPPVGTPPTTSPPATAAPPGTPPPATTTAPPAAAPPPGFTPPGPAAPPPTAPSPVANTAPPPASPSTAPPPGATATTPPPGAAAAAPPPAATTAAPEPAATPTTYAGKAEASTYSRKGLAAGALLGIRACSQEICGRSEDRIRAGAVGRALFEFRPHRNVGVQGELGASYHRINGGDGFRAFASSWSLAALVIAYPLAFTRWDPYVGLGVGFNQDRERYIADEGGDRFQSWSNRGELRLALGLDVFINDIISLGPRFDYGAQFAGKLCDEATDSRKDCIGVSELEAEIRDEAPRWFVLGLQFKAHFGGKKR